MRNPATAALEAFANRLPETEYERARAMASRSVTALVDSIERTHRCLFDMSDLLEASKPVESSISFPIIEWSVEEFDGCPENDENEVSNPESISDDEDDDNDLRVAFSPLGKRSRGVTTSNRLVRSKALKSHLSLLETSFLPISLSFCTDSCGLRSQTDFASKFDVEKWIEIAESAGSTSAFPGAHQRPIPMKNQKFVNTIRRRHALSA